MLHKGGHNDEEHLGDIHLPPLSPDSPVEVEESPAKKNTNDDTPPPTKHNHPTVTINEDISLSPAPEEQNPACPTTTLGSALRNPSPTSSPDGVTHVPQAPRRSDFTLKGLEQGSDYIIDRSQKIYIAHDGDKREQQFHLEDFIGLFPAWPIIELSIIPAGNTKDERMTSFLRCFAALFTEIKYVDDTAAIAPINIYDDNKDNFIVDRTGLPDNFTKLGMWLMISRGSWVFEKKAKGTSEVYARFRLKSQETANKIINRVSFEFNRLGGSRLSKKAAMETETPMMLLFVCNGTDQTSVISDLRQMLDMAYENIDEEGMMPEQFENKDLLQLESTIQIFNNWYVYSNLHGACTYVNSNIHTRKSSSRDEKLLIPDITCSGYRIYSNIHGFGLSLRLCIFNFTWRTNHVISNIHALQVCIFEFTLHINHVISNLPLRYSPKNNGHF